MCTKIFFLLKEQVGTMKYKKILQSGQGPNIKKYYKVGKVQVIMCTKILQSEWPPWGRGDITK